MKGLEQLRKNSRPVLVKMAKRLKIKVPKSHSWTKEMLAKKILEKQKLSELDETPVQPGPESDKPQRKPDFEVLATEGPVIAPDTLQLGKEGPGGVRDGAGRTPGLTDEKARIERIVKNEVPDPTIKFAFECLFEGWENAVKVKGLALSKDETNAIAVPVTNLKEYYFPGFDLSPAIRMWIGLAIGIKAVVQSRIELIRETRKAEQVTQPEQPGDEQKE